MSPRQQSLDLLKRAIAATMPATKRRRPRRPDAPGAAAVVPAGPRPLPIAGGAAAAIPDA